MTTQQAAKFNGWDLEAFEGAVQMVQENPEAGKLIWRSRAYWDAGFGLDVRTEAIEQLGETVPRRFTLRGDHPPELLGENTGPTAVETLLAALGSCVAGTYAAQATARGIRLDALEVEIEGQIDLNGFFGLQPVRPGLMGVSVTIRAKSDADNATLEELREATTKASPVFDSIAHPAAIRAAVERL